MRKDRDASLGEVVIGRYGPVKGARVLAFMVSWGVMMEEAGDRPTAEDQARFWHQHVRTVYRDLARFRECFPLERDPTRIMALAIAEAERAPSVAEMGAQRMRELGVVV